MSNIIMIIAQSQFRDEELFETVAVLTKKGHTVQIASRSQSVCTGSQGGSTLPDRTIREIDSNDFDAVIFVGGGGAKEYFDDQKIFALAREFLTKGKIVGAICIAPVILANAGLLEGKHATVFPSGKDILIKKGAVYTGDPVTTDGRIVTGNGPASSALFAREISLLLNS